MNRFAVAWSVLLGRPTAYRLTFMGKTEVRQIEPVSTWESCHVERLLINGVEFKIGPDGQLQPVDSNLADSKGAA
jgi:hypothetical protein